jgi:hypothetical protein
LVVRPGVTGLTTKHSFTGVASAGSIASGTSVVPEVNVALQQYRPTDVIVAAGESTGSGVAWMIVWDEPIEVPPASQLPFAIGPQRLNASDPVQLVVPLTVS